MACKPGEIEIVHQGGNSAGCWSDIPTYFDTYTKYINGERVLDMVDVGDYDIEQLYTVMYGALEPGEYYNTKDINGDGVNNFYKATEDSEGNEVILTVYGRDDKFQKYELSYDDWLETNPDAWQYDDEDEGPDLSELIAEYGEDVVNDLKGKYDELVDFIGNVPEDPVGSIKKMAEIFVEGTTGIPPECQNVGGGPLDEWYKNCVTVGILVEIGIPGLPSGIGGIFKGATIGEIEEALKKIGKKFEDIVDGNPTCGEDGTQECTPITILGDLGREVLDTIGSIFEDAEGEITVESVLGKLGGIFGTVLGGIIYEEFKDLINDEIENTIGIPVIPFAPLAECEEKGQTTVETSEGSGQFQCGPCKQEGFTPTGPQGECIDPNVVQEDFDCSTVNRQGGIVEKGASEPDENCGECLQGFEEDADGNCIEKEVPPECEGPTAQDCTALHKEHIPCTDVADASCGECLDGYTENEQGQCVEESTTTPDGTGEDSCPEGSERDTPIYDGRDTNQSGNFTTPNGITYSYDPCNPSSGYTMVGQNVNVCEDPNNLNFGNITQQPEEPCGDCKPGFDKPEGYTECTSLETLCQDSGYNSTNPECANYGTGACTDPYDKSTLAGEGAPCSGCTDGFDKPEGYDKCTSHEDLCRDRAPGYRPEDNNPACGEITEEPPEEPPVEPCSNINPATGQPSPRNDMGECVNCNDEANALVCGWFDCGDNVYAPTQDDCPTVEPPPEEPPPVDPCDDPVYASENQDECGPIVDPCNDPVYAAENQDECGPIVDPCDDPIYAAENPNECGYTCDDPNATVQQGGLTPGACGPCKEGYVFDGTVERCVQIEVPSECDDPVYAAANPEECLPGPPTTPPPEPPPPTSSGGGVGGAGVGAFSPFMAGIDYTPQPLPTAPVAPQKDYMMELDNLIKRSLFEGIV